MPDTPLRHVSPGDRITAAWVNQLVDEINAIKAQLAAGGGAPPTGPVITGFAPAGSVAVGAVLEILGQNFGVPATQNVVTFDAVAATGFQPGSSDTRIRVAVPSIPGIPKDVEVVVVTARGTARRSLAIVAPTTPLPVGQPVLRNITPILGTINADATYTFKFEADARAVSRAEQYEVTANFANVAPPTQTEATWRGRTVLIGPSAGRITIDPASPPATIGVQIQIPAGATAADLSLHLRSVHNHPGSSAVSPPVPIRVGQAPQPTHSSIHLGIGTIGAAAPFRKVTIDGAQGLEVRYPTTPAGRTVHVPITVLYDVAGTYHYDVQILDPDTTLWAVGAASPNDLAYAAGGSGAVGFDLTLKATGPSNEARVLEFVARRTDVNDPGFSNFMRIPIRGFTT